MSKLTSGNLHFCLLLLLAMPTLLSAQDFRIETDLYIGESTKASSRNVTIFSDLLVYDFLMSDAADAAPIQIAIFDRTEKKFILLDTEKKVRLEIERSQLIKLLEGLRKETMQDESSRFMADIQFQEDFDISSSQIKAKSGLIQYELKGTHPTDSSILPAYHDFLDHYTMLGATDPQRFPPFARMKFNQIIKKYGWLPSEIRFGVGTDDVFKRAMKAQTQHTLNMNLSDRDQERIEMAKQCWMEYNLVNMAEFRGLPSLAKDEKMDKK